MSTIDKLPNAAVYSGFAYHVALLEQFAAEKNSSRGAAELGRSRSMVMDASGGEKKSSSVHGNQLFDKKLARAHSVIAATNKDNSWHAGQKSGGMNKETSHVT